MRSNYSITLSLLNKIGKYSKRVDNTLLGKHTRRLYDKLLWKVASMLAQLRTSMARLNSYLHQARAAPTDQYVYGLTRDTIEHFLLQYRNWTTYQTEMLQYTITHRSNLSFYLGGKTTADDKTQIPDLKAIRATIRFAIAIGQLLRPDSKVVSVTRVGVYAGSSPRVQWAMGA
jgi:hypothetical protein